MLCGQAPPWRDFLAKLKVRFEFGKWTDRCADFNCRWIEQKSDFSFRVDQRTYIREHLQVVSIDQVDKSDGTRKLLDWEISLMRGMLGKLMWVAQVSGRCGPGFPALSQNA